MLHTRPVRYKSFPSTMLVSPTEVIDCMFMSTLIGVRKRSIGINLIQDLYVADSAWKRLVT